MRYSYSVYLHIIYAYRITCREIYKLSVIIHFILQISRCSTACVYVPLRIFFCKYRKGFYVIAVLMRYEDSVYLTS